MSHRAAEVESFRRYIVSTIRQLVEALDGLDEQALNWRPPAQETNSRLAIVAHVLGHVYQRTSWEVAAPGERDRRDLGSVGAVGAGSGT